MTISKHALRAEIVTPDTYDDQGHYEDFGSWLALTTPEPIEANGFEVTGITGWAKGTAVSVAWAGGSGARSGDYFMFAVMHRATAGVVPPAGTWYITKALTGLTVGRSYKVSAWVHPQGTSGLPATVKIGVAGKAYGSSASFTSADYTTHQQVTYTFTATATSHTVQLSETLGTGSIGSSVRALYVDDYELVATNVWTPNPIWQPSLVRVPGQRIPLDVTDSTIKMDEGWSPYVQGSLNCWTPSADVLQKIDPRTGTRVSITLDQRFGESQPASALPVTIPRGAFNYVTNPNLTSNATGWSAVASTLAWQSGAGHNAAGFGRLTATAVTNFFATGVSFPVVAGEPYEFRVWVRGTVGRSTRLRAAWTGTGSTVGPAATIASSTAWQELVFTGTVPVGATAVNVGPYAVAATIGDVLDFDDVSAKRPNVVTAADVTAAYVGQQAAAISADYGQPYNAFGMRVSTKKRMDLLLRERDLDENAGTMTLQVASDEAASQDYALLQKEALSPNTTSIASAIDLALGKIGAHLTSALDVLVDDAATLVWLPGVTAWDYANQLAQGAERRLWCDEQRVWRLTDPLQPSSGGLNIKPITTAINDTISRDEDWYDGVVVEFNWTDSLGATKVRYDTAGPENAKRVLHVVWNRPYFRSGAAATMLKRFAGRGRNVIVQAVSDYSGTPGDSFNVTLQDGVYQVGMVSSIAWNFPADAMVITTRDLQSAPRYSWADLPAEKAWNQIPVGVTWPNFTKENV